MNKQKWIIRQTWNNVFFFNYRVDFKQLREIVPKYLELDSLEESYYTSVVPFQMNNVEFRFLRTLPFNKLNELNLRTYVKYKGVSGIYFFTLDSNHRLANFIARNLFNLPYQFNDVKIDQTRHHFDIKARDFSLNASVGKDIVKNSQENFFVERYNLFTDNGKQVFRGHVSHEPWDLSHLDIDNINEGLNRRFNLTQGELTSSYYSQSINVSFTPFTYQGSTG